LEDPLDHRPFSELYRSPTPGTTAIFYGCQDDERGPSAAGLMPSDCTTAHAIGTMIAVRTVIDGMPIARTTPIRKNAERMPVYVAGNSERM